METNYIIWKSKTTTNKIPIFKLFDKSGFGRKCRAISISNDINLFTIRTSIQPGNERVCKQFSGIIFFMKSSFLRLFSICAFFERCSDNKMQRDKKNQREQKTKAKRGTHSGERKKKNKTHLHPKQHHKWFEL